MPKAFLVSQACEKNEMLTLPSGFPLFTSETWQLITGSQTTAEVSTSILGVPRGSSYVSVTESALSTGEKADTTCPPVPCLSCHLERVRAPLSLQTSSMSAHTHPHTHTHIMYQIMKKALLGERDLCIHLNRPLSYKYFKPMASSLSLSPSMIPLVTEFHYGITSQVGKHIFWIPTFNSSLLPRDSDIPFLLLH